MVDKYELKHTDARFIAMIIQDNTGSVLLDVINNTITNIILSSDRYKTFNDKYNIAEQIINLNRDSSLIIVCEAYIRLINEGVCYDREIAKYREMRDYIINIIYTNIRLSSNIAENDDLLYIINNNILTVKKGVD